MAQWAKWPTKDALFTNADPTILRVAPAAVENLYANAAGGFSRTPGLQSFLSLPGAGRVYVYGWRDNLVAATRSGKIYRIGQDGVAEDVTGVPLSGGQRPVFSGTEDELVIAAGGPILRLASRRTEILSDNAPASTHVAFVDGYLVAIESHSGRFWYSDPGAYRTWSDLSVFTADAKPDDLNACIVTPYRELLLCGQDSIEQYERLANGKAPFYRRWTTGEGLGYPYTIVADVNGTWGVNKRKQFVEFRAQVSREQSVNVAMTMQAVEDWTDAWAAPILVHGQWFIIVQAPFASNHYGGKGVTFLLDNRTHKWSFLYGWNAAAGQPARWPGWSVADAWGRTFVGVEDGIAEMSGDTYDNLGSPSRVLMRSAHVSDFGPSRIDNVRIRLRRGAGPAGGPVPQVGLRMIRDNARATNWSWRNLGGPGDNDLTLRFGGMGSADTWQMEICCTDSVPFELTEAWAQVERLGW